MGKPTNLQKLFNNWEIHFEFSVSATPSSPSAISWSNNTTLNSWGSQRAKGSHSKRRFSFSKLSHPLLSTQLWSNKRRNTSESCWCIPTVSTEFGSTSSTCWVTHCCPHTLKTSSISSPSSGPENASLVSLVRGYEALTWHFSRRTHIRRGLTCGATGDAAACVSVQCSLFFSWCDTRRLGPMRAKSSRFTPIQAESVCIGRNHQ